MFSSAKVEKSKVYVTRRIPKPGPEFLQKKECELTFWESDEAIPHADLVKNMKADKYDALLCMLTDQVDAEVIAAAGKLFSLAVCVCVFCPCLFLPCTLGYRKQIIDLSRGYH